MISDNFDDEVKLIRDQYIQTGFPYVFINYVIEKFTFSHFDHIIPENLFNDKVEKPNFRIRLPFCHRNESCHFLKKVYSFIRDSFSISIVWNTRKIRSLFPLKDKNLHPCCVVYNGNRQVHISENG